VGQASSLHGYLTERNLKVDHVISLVVSDELVVKRLSGRRTCLDCGLAYHVETHPPRALGICDRCGAKLVQRADDEANTIRERLAVYARQTAPLAAHYRAQGVLQTVDGTETVDQITKTIQKILDER
jgi:adenylate kinase